MLAEFMVRWRWEIVLPHEFLNQNLGMQQVMCSFQTFVLLLLNGISRKIFKDKQQMGLQKDPVSPNEEGEVICSVEIPDVGYTNSIRIAEVFLRQKEGYYKYCFYIHIFIDTKIYNLHSIDLKGTYLS